MYGWKIGSRISADANVAGEVCKQLEAEGNLSAKALLEASRPDDAPLHNAFLWDDTEAAERYREIQARHIIHSLVIVREEVEPVRGFFNIEVNDSSYYSIETILEKADSTAALLKTALRELEAFKKKYRQLEELTEVFKAIDETKERISA